MSSADKKNIIKGTIYNDNHEVIDGAFIQISEIDPYTKITMFLNYTFTDEDGLYLLEVDALDNKFYELAVFPPINS